MGEVENESVETDDCYLEEVGAVSDTRGGPGFRPDPGGFFQFF